MKTLIISLTLGLTLTATATNANASGITIWPGTTSSFCSPSSDPRCQVFNAQEQRRATSERQSREAQERSDRAQRDHDIRLTNPGYTDPAWRDRERRYDQYQIRGPYEYRR